MSDFDLGRSIALLERTPETLRTLLHGLDSFWTTKNEGSDTWSPYDVLGHLVHGESTDWVARTRIILEKGQSVVFESFDRFAQFRESEGKTMEDLLEEFAYLRAKNIDFIRSLNLRESDFARSGIHPVFGPVSLEQLLSTWLVHDLNHIAQICRVMAFQFKKEVGPWKQYLRILN